MENMFIEGFVKVFVIILLTTHSQQEFCSIDENENFQGSDNSNDHYEVLDEKYKHFYDRIDEAENSYVPCQRKECGCYTDVINRDLKPYDTTGIDKGLIERARLRGTLYQVINGKLYRQKDCMFPSRCAGVEHFILKLLSNLSDIEFVINTRDYPQSSVHFGEPLPVFSFSKTVDYHDIMYPAWSFWEGGPAISIYPRGLGRWDRHRISLDRAARNNPWTAKRGKALFRGSRTSPERDNLVLLGRRKPDLVDARYTKNQAWKSDADTLNAAPASEITLEKHCEYRYLFNYRGVAASFRHKHLFLCRSLVFHVGDEWREFYYDAMKKWIHYIPVDKDASQDELERLINFAMDNYEIAKKIANRGGQFVWEKLKMEDVECYWKRLLDDYSKLLTYQPNLRSDFIRIEKT